MEYNFTTKTIIAVRGPLKISLTVGNKFAKVAASTQALDTPAEGINGRVFVPLRFVAETFGAEVVWEESKKNISITLPQLEKALSEANVKISINKFAFNPSEIIIEKGQTVVWLNEDVVPHTVTGKFFDSGTLNTGSVFQQTFSEIGIYDYICTFHTSMKGKIEVK